MQKNSKLFGTVILLIIALLPSGRVLADEGMWLPALLGKYNIAAMQAQGCKLTAEQIYSINQACIKDAVVIFGNICTAEIVSDNGLLFTNHHCGLGSIQNHSSVDNDLIKKGYWAKNLREEMPNPGLTVTFLIRMEDVTGKVFEGIDSSSDDAARIVRLNRNISRVQSEAVKGTDYRALIKPLFYGAEYYLFVYDEFRDVRLVAAPPASIGKFGGDTDNWVWPRHTGDFSIFRIYAGKNNRPADYSADNQPYKPKKFLPISLKGVKEGDFTMVLGYPGRTQQFLTSHALEWMTNWDLPSKIYLRDQRLQMMAEAMQQSDALRLQYIAKYYDISNSWKKWEGTLKGLTRSNAIRKKEVNENLFQSWAEADPGRRMIYGNLLHTFDSLYTELSRYTLAVNYINEGIYGSELMNFVPEFYAKREVLAKSDSSLKTCLTSLKRSSDAFFKAYYQPLDKRLLIWMLKEYAAHIEPQYQPDVYHEINLKFKGNIDTYVDYLWKKSLFTNKERMDKWLRRYGKSSLAKLNNDPAYKLYISVSSMYQQRIQHPYEQLSGAINNLYALYVDGLREMQPTKQFYPDANFTMRVTYGKVGGYNPSDAVQYDYATSLSGVIEKEDPAIEDYEVPAKLKQLYKSKDYGRYGVNGTMPVCFLASNHTAGGNSGAPVLNAEGQLIGLNFDRNWEGTMSDIVYDPAICRNIVVDIRYVLFVIDKFAGAQNLIDELTIVE